MRHSLLISLMLSVFMYSCTSGESPVPDYAGLQYDSTRIKIFTFSKTNALMPDDARPAELSQDDVDAIDSLYKACLQEYNLKTTDKLKTMLNLGKIEGISPATLLLNPDDYFRQYIPYRDNHNRRIVQVNAFCNADPAWRTKVVVKEGGGKCYFTLKINVTPRTCSGLQIHPEDPESK